MLLKININLINYQNLIGPPSHMQPVIDWKVVMRCMIVHHCWVQPQRSHSSLIRTVFKCFKTVYLFCSFVCFLSPIWWPGFTFTQISLNIFATLLGLTLLLLLEDVFDADGALAIGSPSCRTQPDASLLSCFSVLKIFLSIFFYHWSRIFY